MAWVDMIESSLGTGATGTRMMIECTTDISINISGIFRNELFEASTDFAPIHGARAGGRMERGGRACAC
jgi:hypothetical protein